AAKTLILRLQVTEASLKGLAAGTRDGLHTLIIGAVPAAAARPRSRSRDQSELDALNKYPGARAQAEKQGGVRRPPGRSSWSAAGCVCGPGRGRCSTRAWPGRSSASAAPRTARPAPTICG